MTNNADIFEKLLGRFRFRQPVPKEVRRFALDYKRKALADTLNNFGHYTLIYGFVLRIYYLSNKLGLGFSVAQSMFILGIISFFIGLILSAGILLSIIHFKVFDTEPLRNIKSPVVYKKEGIIKKPVITKKNQHSKESVRPKLGIKRFTGDFVDSNFTNIITDKIAGGLIRLKGKNRVIDLRKGGMGAKINMALTGSIEKLGSEYIITARVINVENYKVIYITSEDVYSIDKIDDACSRIAGKIAEFGIR